MLRSRNINELHKGGGTNLGLSWGLLHRRRQVRRPLDGLSGEAQTDRQETTAIANPLAGHAVRLIDPLDQSERLIRLSLRH